MLSESGAKVTEKNQLGNSALLLAAAYGHLDIVQYLLNTEDHPHFSEANSLGNTALLMAAYHGQIAVVDYLIRNYYLNFEFNDKEKEDFDCFSRNRTIRYYLDVFKLCSSKPVNESDLKSLLAKVSKQLNTQELSFIYLICLWMLVSQKITLASHVINVNDPSFQKFFLSHQGELITHMIEAGYVLDIDTNQESLPISGISLDKDQIAIIKKLLKKCPSAESKNPSAKEKELYTAYYLIPLYRSLVHAYRSNRLSSDLDAIKEPYLYHLNKVLKTSDEPLVDEDVVKWTAYHLCKNPTTTIQEHQRAYARTVGGCRTAYYESVKKYLTDGTFQE